MLASSKPPLFHRSFHLGSFLKFRTHLTGGICGEAGTRPPFDEGNRQNWTWPCWEQGAGWLQGDFKKMNLSHELDSPKVKIWRIATTETLQVPAGAGVKDSSRKTDLLYNEYIVYDVAQVFFLYSEDQVKGSWYKPNASPSPLTPLLFQNNVALYWRLFLSWLFSWLVHRLSQSGAKCASVAFLIWPMKTN